MVVANFFRTMNDDTISKSLVLFFICALLLFIQHLNIVFDSLPVDRDHR